MIRSKGLLFIESHTKDLNEEIQEENSEVFYRGNLKDLSLTIAFEMFKDSNFAELILDAGQKYFDLKKTDEEIEKEIKLHENNN